MKKSNVIGVLSPDGREWLMCLRRKDPYKGLYNLVGGKVEPGETGEEAAYRELAEETPMGRLGTPEEVAGAALFLCGEGASFITGQVLGVSGGLIT